VYLPVLLCSLGLCGVAALAFGLVPALQVSGSNLHDALREGGEVPRMAPAGVGYA
jgi:hypothetical protein